jgi:hypothetical protein
MPTTKADDTIAIPAADWASLQARLAVLEAAAAQPAAAAASAPFSAESFATAFLNAQRMQNLETPGIVGKYAEMLEADRHRVSWPQAMYECRSLLTGASFTAVVSPSRTFPQGRIVDLRDYRQDDDFDTRFPFHGAEEDKTNAKGQPSVHYKQHCYAEGWRKDLNEYVGKSFNPALVPEVAAKLERLKAEALAEIESESAAVVAAAQPIETKVL